MAGVLSGSDTYPLSEYGACGVGAYCLGGCDPASSYSTEACVPEPVCVSKSWEWNNLNSVMDQQKYLGDSSKADWVSSGQPVTHDGQLWLTMNEGSVGTLLKSTTSMWYGKISARLATSAGAGVVTAFILLGNSKDEIDFEWVGTELTTTQTNFYSLGITNCKQICCSLEAILTSTRRQRPAHKRPN
jgi:beta-glucanase (GH16 family)